MTPREAHHIAHSRPPLALACFSHREVRARNSQLKSSSLRHALLSLFQFGNGAHDEMHVARKGSALHCAISFQVQQSVAFEWGRFPCTAQYETARMRRVKSNGVFVRALTKLSASADLRLSARPYGPSRQRHTSRALPARTSAQARAGFLVSSSHQASCSPRSFSKSRGVINGAC